MNDQSETSLVHRSDYAQALQLLCKAVSITSTKQAKVLSLAVKWNSGIGRVTCYLFIEA